MQKLVPVINNLEMLIIQCKVMRLPEKEALIWLGTRGHQISARSYYYRLQQIEQKTSKRAIVLAQRGLLDIHMRMVDTLEVCERMLWSELHRIEDPFKRTLVIKTIVEMQPFITGAYDQTREVMEEQARLASQAMNTIEEKGKRPPAA